MRAALDDPAALVDEDLVRRRIVDRRWAMAIVVRPSISAFEAAWISRSQTVSRADVASSRIRIRGSFSRTRAIAMRCFSPPDSL